MTAPMSGIVHLVRHGEVENPDHIVYADLPGFGLSAEGRSQARELADHLRDRPIAAVCSSPLLRARQTAAPIAAAGGMEVTVVDDLTEWRLLALWSGVRWEELSRRFPGELEAYLTHPWNLPASPESLQALAARMIAAIDRLRPTTGELVLVSHQDPLQAARLTLTGRDLRAFWDGKPAHAEVISLRPDRPWLLLNRWQPARTYRLGPG